MTWSFNSTDLSASKDQVRLYVGDVDSADPLLTDEEIAFAVTQAGSVRAASALAADWISALFSRRSDKSTGDLSLSASQKSKQYAELAARLRRESALLALPYFGGISIAAKDAREADTDRVKPAFTMEMLDDPEVSAGEAGDAEADA